MKPDLESATGGTAERDRIWKQAYQARSQDDLLRLYESWAERYDDDHEAIGFVGHRVAADTLARHLTEGDRAAARVLDAGAGTGAAGVALADLGFRELTAFDLSRHMLARAGEKGIYRELHAGDLGQPLDPFEVDQFDAAILVGVFSFGQAPAHALEEIHRVVKPGGRIVFTMRTDFFDSDEMGVRSKVEELEERGAWKQLEVTDPQLYLPKKDPNAKFRVWCYEVKKGPKPSPDFAAAVRAAMTAPEGTKRFDHCHIWDAHGSRLYNRYIDRPEYYLVDCEEEILEKNASEIVGQGTTFVELGCGSARKIKILFDELKDRAPRDPIHYVPIDVSEEALSSTQEELAKTFDDDFLRVEPRQGLLADVLPSLSKLDEKTILFFGSSIGNIESREETIEFLRAVRQNLSKGDRFIIGIDLDKDDSVLQRAYEAGPENLSFFINVVRRMNNELGANFDLESFFQDSRCEPEPELDGIHSRCIEFRLVSQVDQPVVLPELGLDTVLSAGEAIQVGISRKYRRESLAVLAERAGFELARQWVDSRGYFSVNEFVPK